MANALQFSNIVLSQNPFSRHDPLQVSFSAKNISGKKITKVDLITLRWYHDDTYTTIGTLDYSAAVSWASGKTRSFSGLEWVHSAAQDANIDVYFLNNPTVRALPITMWIATELNNGDDTEYSTVEIGSRVYKRYVPGINKFSVARWAQANPDESDKVRVTLDIDTVDSTYFSGMTVRLYYSTGDVSTSSSYVDLTSQISSLVGAGEVDLDMTQTFGTGDSWNFMLVFGDDYESVTAYASVPNAFANMHLAGFSTGGVAFGKFSSSTQGNPLLECAYPAIFSSDVISPLGNLLKVVQVTDTVSVSSGSATASKTISVSPGSGWTPIGVVGFKASQSWCSVREAMLVNGDVEMSLRYHGSSSSSQTVTLTADVLCLHTSIS